MLQGLEKLPGTRLFPPGYNVNLQLAETRTFGNGVVLLRYRRA